jgi:hypothetical protein
MTGSNIAAAINAAHDQVEASKREAVKHAIDCGRLLIEAKATAKHGEWDAWVSQHCSFSMRTAQLYMKAFRHVGDDPLKAQRVADMSLRDLAAFMAQPIADEVAGRRLANMWDSSDQRVKAGFAMSLYDAGQITFPTLQAMLTAAGLTSDKATANLVAAIKAHVPAEHWPAVADNFAKAGSPQIVKALSA